MYLFSALILTFRLSWERALAATVLLPRCNFAAQCKFPLELIATETARFLCQINCSRVMLRAASDSGKGDRKDKANRDFEVFIAQSVISSCHR